MIAAVSASLVILGCSQRKRQTSRILPAIDRYDGPVFRVLRKHSREEPENPTAACILSARFGLIPAKRKIPRYDRRLSGPEPAQLRQRVKIQLARALREIKPKRLFVSVGARYWPLLNEALEHGVATRRVVVATGGIGGRASQLSRWLGSQKSDDTPTKATGKARLLGTTLSLTRAEVFQQARRGLTDDLDGARRFETWYVPIGRHRVAPKWLVSVLFNKPVARFRTADARRVLSLLGVPCVYANRY
jgi:hypothetical protein